jgi:magnesium transporter
MIQILIRRPDGSIESQTDPPALPAVAAQPECLFWIQAQGESPEALDLLAKRFTLHPVTAEDLVNRNQAVKIEEFENYAFLVLYALRKVTGDSLDTEEIHVVLTRNALLTAYAEPLDITRRMFERCKNDPRLLTNGPDFLLYLVSGAVVDAYFPILDALEDEIDELEDAVISAPARSRLQRIFELKRVLVELRKLIGPLRERFNTLSRRDFPYIQPRTAVYFRDVHDHLVRAHEMTEAYRDFVINVMEAYLASTSNRLGQVMKHLTIIATIFMPLSFLTGFFGMNFTGIPFDNAWLLALALLTMVGLPVGMLVLFLRAGWISDQHRITSLARLRAWLRHKRGPARRL